MTKNHDVYSGLGIEGDIIDEEKDILEIFEDATDDLQCSPEVADIEELALVKEKTTRVAQEEDVIKSSTERLDGAQEEEKEEEEGTLLTPQQSKLHVTSDTTALPIDQSIVPESGMSEKSDVPPTTHSHHRSHNEQLQSNEDQARRVLEKQIQRAECIAESLEGIKIFPILGGITSIAKPKFEGFFDGIFVSARSAQCIQQDSFKKLLKKSNNSSSCGGGLIAVETAKFFVPLSKKMQKDFTDKEEEYAAAHGWVKIAPPVSRRRRDEMDLEDDVMFFRN